MNKICLIQDVLIGSLKPVCLHVSLQENILNSLLRKHKRQLKQKNGHLAVASALGILNT